LKGNGSVCAGLQMGFATMATVPSG
jgi:hypothetical protein